MPHGDLMDLPPSEMAVELDPPDYIFDLIQISIFAAAGDVPALTTAIESARNAGAGTREILRAMFRSDDAFAAGIENSEFMRLVESLQAGYTPALSS